MNTTSLLWKPIKGYEELYEVSNLGHVRRTRTGRQLRPIKRRGYSIVSLYKEGKAEKCTIHKLVIEGFTQYTLKGHTLTVSHINGDLSDNRLDNLRVLPHGETVAYAFKKKALNNQF